MNDALKEVLNTELLAKNNAVRDALIQGDGNAIREILRNKAFSGEVLALEESEIGPFLDKALFSQINDDSFVAWLLAGIPEQATLKRKRDDEPSISSPNKHWTISFHHLKVAIRSRNYTRIAQFRNAMNIDWQKKKPEIEEILWLTYNDIYNSSNYISSESFESLLEILCDKKGININLQDADGETLLHKEVAFIAKQIADADANTPDEILDENGNIKETYTDILAILLRKGAHINLTNYRGYTPLDLMMAAQYRCWPGIKYLLQHGANPNLRQFSLGSPFHRMIKLCEEEVNIFKDRAFYLEDIVRTFLFYSAHEVNLQDQDGKTPLHLALCCYRARINHINSREDMEEAQRKTTIAALLEEEKRVITAFRETGADIHLSDSSGKKPLHHAHTVAKELLNTELLAKNNAVRDALIQCDGNAIREILRNKAFSGEVLTLEGPEIGPLLDDALLSQINDDSFVAWLLAGIPEQATLKRKRDDEPSISSPNKHWTISFHHLKAAIKSENYTRIAQFRNAMNIDWQQNTPEIQEILWLTYKNIYNFYNYNYMSSESFESLLDVLCDEKGININLQDADGETLLHKEVVMVAGQIADADTDNDIMDENGNIKETYTDILAPLLKKGADINLRNHKGDTPFHLMMKYRCWPGIKYLLQNRANPSLRDSKGQSSFHRTIKLYEEEIDNFEEPPSYLEDIVRTFLFYNANEVNLQDQDKKTPLHLAMHCYRALINHINSREDMEEAQQKETIATVLEEKERVIRAFLEAGANIHLPDSSGEKPLHDADKSVAQAAVMKEDWQMFTPYYNSFFQWLPRELAEDVIAIVNPIGIPTIR